MLTKAQKFLLYDALEEWKSGCKKIIRVEEARLKRGDYTGERIKRVEAEIEFQKEQIADTDKVIEEVRKWTSGEQHIV